MCGGVWVWVEGWVCVRMYVCMYAMILPYPTLPHSTLPCPTLPVPSLPCTTLTLSYFIVPYPTLPYPTLTENEVPLVCDAGGPRRVKCDPLQWIITSLRFFWPPLALIPSFNKDNKEATLKFFQILKAGVGSNKWAIKYVKENENQIGVNFRMWSNNCSSLIKGNASKYNKYKHTEGGVWHVK